MISDSRLANISARAILDAFEKYTAVFQTITRRAKTRFESRNWHGIQVDAAERIDLYKKATDTIKNEICDMLAERIYEKLIWTGIKAVYSGLITPRDDWELAETFFNSVTRRIFTTVGVDIQIEFVGTDFETPPTPTRNPVFSEYGRSPTTTKLISQILQDYNFSVPYNDCTRDAKQVAARIEAHLYLIGALCIVDRVEMVRSVFYRGKGAYLIGHLFSGPHLVRAARSSGLDPRALLLPSGRSSDVHEPLHIRC